MSIARIKLNTTTKCSKRFYLLRDRQVPTGWIVARGQDNGKGYQSRLPVEKAMACEWVPAEAKRALRRLLPSGTLAH